MRKRSTLVQIVVASLMILAPTAATRGEIRQAAVVVDGMACPFCAFGLEKRLKKVDGVAEVKTSIREGEATLIAGKGTSIDVREIPNAIRKAGFTPGTISIIVIGDLRAEGSDRLLLHVAGTSIVLAIAGTSGRIEARLRSFASDGALVQITGEVGGAGEGLSITPATVQAATSE